MDALCWDSAEKAKQVPLVDKQEYVEKERFGLKWTG